MKFPKHNAILKFTPEMEMFGCATNFAGGPYGSPLKMLVKPTMKRKRCCSIVLGWHTVAVSNIFSRKLIKLFVHHVLIKSHQIMRKVKMKKLKLIMMRHEHGSGGQQAACFI